MKPLLRCAPLLKAGLLLLTVVAACSKSSDAPLPADPTGFRATVAGSDVRLHWQDPADPNLKEYSLSYLPDGVPRTIPKDSVSVLLTQLQEGGTYTFSLKARDRDGNLSSGATVTVTVVDTSGATSSAGATYTGDITFASQADINRFSKGINRVDGKVIISGAAITSLLPLAKLDSVKGLEIYFNDTLTSLQGLHNLKYVGGTLYLRDNKKLTHIDALSGLRTVGKDLVVLDHPKLENLSGLAGLQRVGGSVYIGVEGWKTPPKARGNAALANFCGLKPLLAAGGVTDSVVIQNNLKNPSKAEILTACP